MGVGGGGGGECKPEFYSMWLATSACWLLLPIIVTYSKEI